MFLSIGKRMKRTRIIGSVYLKVLLCRPNVVTASCLIVKRISTYDDPPILEFRHLRIFEDDLR